MLGKLIVLIAKATAVPMRDATSFWSWALWIPAIVCFANLVQNILYVWWVQTRPEWTRMPTGRRLARSANAGQRRKPGQAFLAFIVSVGRVLTLVPRIFWLVVCSQSLQAGVVGSFSSLNADIIATTRGSTAQIAGYTSAVQQVIPVVCAPLLGGFFDFYGKRMLVVSVTSGIWILVYC